jgi:hypothetical protein
MQVLLAAAAARSAVGTMATYTAAAMSQPTQLQQLLLLPPSSLQHLLHSASSVTTLALSSKPLCQTQQMQQLLQLAAVLAQVVGVGLVCLWMC